MGWQPIETLPDEMKDGREIHVKRVYERQLVAEGPAVFGLPHAAAPMRQSLGPDPLGRLSAADYEREEQARREMVSEKRWLKPDRMCAFPTPTHWRA